MSQFERMLWHGKYRLSEGVSVRIPCQWSQFSRPSISRISPPPRSQPLSHQESLLEEKNNRWTPWENWTKKGFWELLWREGGVKVVKSEHQLQRMMSHWNEKLLSPTPHLSSQPTLTFRMSCVYQSWYSMSWTFSVCMILSEDNNQMNFYASFSPYYHGFEHYCCTLRSYAEVTTKLDSTPPIAYPLAIILQLFKHLCIQ